MGRAEKWFLTPFLWVAVLVAAASLRLVCLDNRPMHCDEANHADKFRLLLEHGDYTYNPYEYHGPSLNFLTLPIARLAGLEKLTEVTEIHLRLLPAIFGIVLVGLVWLLRDEFGRGATLAAALLTAVSPAMVFFSRYYIQEMLLVCFTFGAIVALNKVSGAVSVADPSSRCKKRFSAPCSLVLLGICVGMMHASKETCVIALLAMAPAAAVSFPELRRIGAKRIALAGLIVAISAATVSVLLFSSFFHNPGGVIDSFTTYFHYLGRSSGEGSVGRHVQSWDYYFRILFWWNRGGGHAWSEASIAALALVGLVAAVWGKGLKPAHLPMARFLCIYTVIMTVVYSALPYKTPWCALGFLHGMILLGGIGADVLIRLAPGAILKSLLVVALAAAAGHLGWQAYRASFVVYREPDNPYFYAHTTVNIPLLAQRAKQIAASHTDGKAMPIQVICPEHDYWPLPWYLREFSRAEFSDRVHQRPAAPLIIIMPSMMRALEKYLYVDPPPGQRPLYVPVLPDDENTDWELYRNVFLYVYVRHDL